MKKMYIKLAITVLGLFFVVACGGGNQVKVTGSIKECKKDTDCVDSVGNTGICLQGTCDFGNSTTQSEDPQDPVTCDTYEINCLDKCIVCNNPPTSFCQDNDTYIAYSHSGVCNEETGDCDYQPNEIVCFDCYSNCEKVCNNISCADKNGGCYYNGVCVGNSDGPSCEYDTKADESQCILSSSPTTANYGMCLEGTCVECIQHSDCDDGDSCTGDECDMATHQCNHKTYDNCGIDPDPDPDPDPEDLEGWTILAVFNVRVESNDSTSTSFIVDCIYEVLTTFELNIKLIIKGTSEAGGKFNAWFDPEPGAIGPGEIPVHIYVKGEDLNLSVLPEGVNTVAELTVLIKPTEPDQEE